MQRAIPFLFMRGGSSRGPYFDRSDLPEDRDTLSEVLISLIGSGHPLNIDGIGGGASVTTKVAMMSRSSDEWADVDYFLAQVGVEDGLVDYRPTCGNILSGVGPASLEMGLLSSSENETVVRIRAVNTGARVLARVKTPGGTVIYEGDTSIDGVPGTAAPIELQFMDIVGGVTGSMLPTGRATDDIDGIEVTCMDVAMPIVIGRASDFGLSGTEKSSVLDD
ncbi:MAG: PrpF domain-containing protein, partial [Desulfofustis sp.]